MSRLPFSAQRPSLTSRSSPTSKIPRIGSEVQVGARGIKFHHVPVPRHNMSWLAMIIISLKDKCSNKSGSISGVASSAMVNCTLLSVEPPTGTTNLLCLVNPDRLIVSSTTYIPHVYTSSSFLSSSLLQKVNVHQHPTFNYNTSSRLQQR